MMANMGTVRAIDLGSGNTKFVTGHPPGKPIQCMLFPSLAPEASALPDLDAGILGKPNIVTVAVNGVDYTVGRDSALVMRGSHAHVLDANYVTTDVYAALMYGALHYMGIKHIDYLVVGLPITTYAIHKDTLVERFTGSHQVPGFGRGGDTAQVTIRQVLPMAQPLGALLDYGVPRGLFKAMKHQTNLLIDAGKLTVDALLTHGIKPITARSGADNVGMTEVLHVMAEALSRDLGVQLEAPDLHNLDLAVRIGRPMELFGKPVAHFDKYLKIGYAKTRQAAARIRARVGAGSDIHNIILSGGAARFYQPAIQEFFPRHTIIMADDPVFAIVRGFQWAGEELAGKRRNG